VIKSGVRLDNRWIVPHNLELLKKYDAHINTEWCNKSIFIKYIFKYITKGQEIIDCEDTPMDEETNSRNEVKEYLDTWYICPFDWCWPVFGFKIQHHFHSLEKMPIHLPNENYVTYDAEADMTEILSQEFLQKTILTEWFVANQRHPDARNLTYCDFPSSRRWNEKTRTWEK
jgi:hypothetical protein